MSLFFPAFDLHSREVLATYLSAGLDGVVPHILTNHLSDLAIRFPPGANEVTGLLDRHHLYPFLFENLNDGQCVMTILPNLNLGHLVKRLCSAIELSVGAGSDLLR